MLGGSSLLLGQTGLGEAPGGAVEPGAGGQVVDVVAAQETEAVDAATLPPTGACLGAERVSLERDVSPG